MYLGSPAKSAPAEDAPYPTKLYKLNASVLRSARAVRGRIACSSERNGPTSPAPTVMFPTMPASTGAHQSVETNNRVPATKSVRAKKTSVLLRPIRSARSEERRVGKE